MFWRAKRKPAPGLYVPIARDHWGLIGGFLGGWAHCAFCKVAYKNEIGFNIVTDRVISFPSAEDKKRHRVRYFENPSRQTLCKQCACKLVDIAYDKIKNEPLPGDICGGFDPELLMITDKELDWAIDMLHNADEAPKMTLLLENEKGAILPSKQEESSEEQNTSTST
jgi:hypothetical protein